MKLSRSTGRTGTETSHPARGAWIEIAPAWEVVRRVESHPARGAWIEMLPLLSLPPMMTSHPARGAWIEIGASTMTLSVSGVAPRKGCVD